MNSNTKDTITFKRYILRRDGLWVAGRNPMAVPQPTQAQATAYLQATPPITPHFFQLPTPSTYHKLNEEVNRLVGRGRAVESKKASLQHIGSDHDHDHGRNLPLHLVHTGAAPGYLPYLLDKLVLLFAKQACNEPQQETEC